MREIIFRAWDEIDEKFALTTILDDYEFVFANGYVECKHAKQNRYLKNLGEMYFGIDDKLGNMFFENDVIEFEDCMFDQPFINRATLYWNSELAKWGLKDFMHEYGDDYDMHEYLILSVWLKKYCIVVGNIHQGVFDE